MSRQIARNAVMIRRYFSYPALYRIYKILFSPKIGSILCQHHSSFFTMILFTIRLTSSSSSSSTWWFWMNENTQNSIWSISIERPNERQKETHVLLFFRWIKPQSIDAAFRFVDVAVSRDKLFVAFKHDFCIKMNRKPKSSWSIIIIILMFIWRMCPPTQYVHVHITIECKWIWNIRSESFLQRCQI